MGSRFLLCVSLMITAISRSPPWHYGQLGSLRLMDLPALIRLDLVFNQIPGEHLQYIAGSRHIQTLMLGANKIEKI